MEVSFSFTSTAALVHNLLIVSELSELALCHKNLRISLLSFLILNILLFLLLVNLHVSRQPCPDWKSACMHKQSSDAMTKVRQRISILAINTYCRESSFFGYFLELLDSCQKHVCECLLLHTVNIHSSKCDHSPSNSCNRQDNQWN